jgi:hypothetical protein
MLVGARQGIASLQNQLLSRRMTCVTHCRKLLTSHECDMQQSPKLCWLHLCCCVCACRHS